MARANGCWRVENAGPATQRPAPPPPLSPLSHRPLTAPASLAADIESKPFANEHREAKGSSTTNQELLQVEMSKIKY